MFMCLCELLCAIYFLKNLAGDKGRIPNSYIEGVHIPLDPKNLQEAGLVRAFQLRTWNARASTLF